MKKTTRFLIVGLICMAMIFKANAFIVYANEADSHSDGYCYHVLDDNTVFIDYYEGSTTNDLVIPDYIEDKKVTVIGPTAFRNRDDLTGTLTIGNNVEIIREGAFEGCKGFTKLVISDSVKRLEGFSGCSGFTGTLKIGKNVKAIEYGAFKDCSGFTSLILPEGLECISDKAFQGCSGLTGKLIIPDGVKIINHDAFAGCNFTGSVTIPASFEDYDSKGVDYSEMIRYCPKITKVINNSRIPVEAPLDAERWVDLETGNILYDYIVLPNSVAISDDYEEEDEPDHSEDSDDSINDDADTAELDYGGETFSFHNWSPSKLLKSKPEARQDLAQLCLILSSRTYGDDAQKNLDEALTKLNLLDEDVATLAANRNNTQKRWHRRYGESTMPAHTFALKTYSKNGKKYNIITIIVRGSSDASDWINNFTPNGFIKTASEVYEDLEYFLIENDIHISDENNRYFIMGHSLGGAVANLLQYKIIKNSLDSSDEDAVFANKIICYTYASPCTIWDYDRKESGFGYSMNFINPDDIVPLLSNDIGLFLNRNNLKGYKGMRYGFDIDLGDMTNNVKERYSQYSGIDLDTYVSSLLNPIDKLIVQRKEIHSCEMYMALIKESIKDNTFANKFAESKTNSGHMLSAYCPVDINVIDATTGEVVASIVNNEIQFNKNEDILMTVVGDQKFIKLPLDSDYRIQLTGNDDGTMNYVIQDIKTDDRGVYLANTKRFDNVKLNTGKKMECVIEKSVDNSEIQLIIVDKEGNPIEEIFEDGTEGEISENERENHKDTEHEDSDDEKEEHSSSTATFDSATLNALIASFYVNGKLLTAAKIGRQNQGPLGTYAFTMGTPKGWKEAFSFNLTINGKDDHTNKNGMLCMFIPDQYKKAGRTYALTALDRTGKVHIFDDIDNSNSTIISNIDVDGYAFELIYRD